MADPKRPWSPPQLIWSAVVAMVVWSGIGFDWLGFGFGWTTHSDAKQMTVDVVQEYRAAICVAQASNGSGSTASLQRFAELDQWRQRKYVEKFKWAIVPGAEIEEHGVADLCARKLREAS